MASTTLEPAGSEAAEAARDTDERQYMNPYLAGIGLGLVLLAAFVLMGRGLGASGAVKALVAYLGHLVAPATVEANAFLGEYVGGPDHPLKAFLVFEVVGVFVGALLSGLLAGRVSRTVEKGPRASIRGRFVGAFTGGALMAIGAALARGCTSGQALTGGALLNAGSWVVMVTFFGGAYALAYFMRWQWR